jgi:amino acid permease
MTRTQNSKRNFRSFAGTAMFIVGAAVLVAYSVAIAWQFHAALDRSAVDSLGLFGSVGLASLHVVRAVALDHAAVLSVVRHILILFSAFLVMLVGIALLARRARGVNAPGGRSFSAPPRGDQ